MKLLKYKTFEEQQKVFLYFEGKQTAVLYKFGNTYYSDCSELILKSALIDIKNKLIRDGLTADLSEFINQEFKEYGDY